MKNITIAGRLGRDAKLRAVNDTSVLGFSVAVDDRRKGEKLTMWFDCAIWGRRGESLERHLTKGTQVTVSGDLSTREYTTQAGATLLSLGVKVSEITLQGGGSQSGGGQRPAQGGAQDFDDGGFGDDIPF